MAISQHAHTSGQSFHTYIVKVCCANTVRRFCVLASKSAEALQSVLNRQPEGMAFSAACHMVGGAQ
jgi:hypothetical protein